LPHLLCPRSDPAWRLVPSLPLVELIQKVGTNSSTARDSMPVGLPVSFTSALIQRGGVFPPSLSRIDTKSKHNACFVKTFIGRLCSTRYGRALLFSNQIPLASCYSVIRPLSSASGFAGAGQGVEGLQPAALLFPRRPHAPSLSTIFFAAPCEPLLSSLPEGRKPL